MLRVGVVVPPSNPTAEPEVAACLAGAAVSYGARLPVLHGLDLRDRLAGYNTHLAATIATVAGLEPAAVLVGCTGSSYALGPAADGALYGGLSDRFGFPVTGAAGAIRSVLQALDAARIAVVSPYPAWLTEQSAQYWTACGLTVAAVYSVTGHAGIYQTTPAAMAAAVAAALADTRRHRVDAVVVTGTGAPSLAALDAAAPDADVPLLSSNLCGALTLLQRAGPAHPEAAPPALTRLVHHLQRREPVR